ncbi:hypothetical protein DFP74_1820 [Nocardiopsis sp. Huas11]|uniref:hypothetical protein n=1 Tax=Nocardiopsis sp. Huas11 TaxID=2183912 RepID=UPI000EB08B52|nr:hypothetical protein [Nocardiopsis sp. Huas11]RKS06196.1 hypothetical protein DFP74_1820 [Nocardiopsis sp. Huas11]
MSPKHTSLLTDEVAEARRLTAARFAELKANMGSESGDKGGGGGNKDFAEALLLAVMGSTVSRTGLSNQGSLARAAVHGALRKRSEQSRGAAFFAEEHVGYSPNVAMAALGLARKADPRMVAQALGVDVARVRQAQQSLRLQDMDGVLRADYHTGVIEQAARANLWQQGPGGPDTPPEQVWRLALDENTDLGKMSARDLAQVWLSAANSQEPGAREAQEKAFDALAENHHLEIAESIERHTWKDVNFVGDPHSSRIDANSVMSAASPQADGRPMQTMEEVWNKAIPAVKDPGADPNKVRDSVESLIAAALDGKAPGASLLQVVNDAKRIPGFTEAYNKGLEKSEARAAKGGADTFPQGEALLYALDKNRGFPTNEPRDRDQDVRAVNAGGAALRSPNDPAVAADPRLVLSEGAKLPKGVGQVRLGQERLGASAVNRPEVGLAEADARRTGAAKGSTDVRSANGAGVRARHEDGQGVRVDRKERRAEITAGNRHSGEQRQNYLRGKAASTVGGDSQPPQGKRAAQAAKVRLMASHNRHRRTTASTTTRRTTTTTTRRGAAR